MKKDLKIVLTGGGTAGHIMPILYLAKLLKKNKNNKIYFIGEKQELAKELISKFEIPYYSIYAGKMRRYLSFANLLSPFQFATGFFQSLFILRKIKPDLVFAKGGYVTVPAGLAAKFLKIKLMIHESDVKMGLSNKILAKFAVKIFTNFSVSYYPEKYHQKMTRVGIPINPDFLNTPDQNILESLGLTKKMPTVLIFGGSLGAQNINFAVSKILAKLLQNYQVIHITGKLNYEKFLQRQKRLPKDMQKNYKIFDFLHSQMPQVLASCDLVICRSGANSLNEISALAKPAILIPLPSAASNHQLYNAKIFQREKAAILIEESKLNSQKLFKTIRDLLKREFLLKTLGENANKMYFPNSTEKIAEEIKNREQHL